MQIFLKHVINVISIVLSFTLFLSGCASRKTISSDSTIITRVKNDSHFYLADCVRLEHTPAGSKEKLKIYFNVHSAWEEEQLRKSWDNVEYSKWIAFAGTKGYDAERDGQETVMAVIATVGTIGLIWFLTAGISAASIVYPKANIAPMGTAMLPLISGSEYKSKEENAPAFSWIEKKKIRYKKISSTIVKEPSDSFRVFSLVVDVSNATGLNLYHGELQSGDEIPVALMDLIADGETSLMNVRVTSSQSCRVEFINRVISFQTRKLIGRLLKSEVLAEPGVALVLSSFDGLDDSVEGNSDKHLDAGENGVLVFTVKNQGAGIAYLPKISTVKIHPEIAGKFTSGLLLLSPGSAVQVKVPFSIPLTTPDGVVCAEFIAKDAFGRESAPFKVELPCRHRELPLLQIVDVDLHPCIGMKGSYDLEVSIRNKGKGSAEKVKLKVDGAPNIGTLLAKTCSVDSIGPYSRQTATLRIKIPASSSVGELKLKLVATERFGVGNVERDIVIPIISPN